jgi:hypothetical protein
MTTKLASLGALLLGVVLAVAVGAGELTEIELIDGSIIHAEIISVTEGAYRVESASLGIMEIAEANIRAIRPGAGDKLPDTAESALGAEMQGVWNSLLGDEEIMEMILSLEEDPDMQEVLNDPAIMRAVQAGDTEALISNPKFMKLLENSTIKKIHTRISDE